MNTNLIKREKVSIMKLVLMETGTYNPFYQRPWETHFDQVAVDNLVERLTEVGTSMSNRISPDIFTGLSSNIIHPCTVPQKQVNIPNGWNEKRLRFLLAVEVTDTVAAGTIYYFQGYSDYLGVGIKSGSIDPEMVFIINSFIRVNRHNISTIYGNEVRDVVTESAQIMNGVVYQDASNDVSFKMRPYDIFTGMHSVHLQNNYNKESMYDTRLTLQPSDSIRSNRSNNVASKYLAGIIDSHRFALDEYDGFGQENQTIYEQSSARAYEEGPTHNVFLRALSNLKGRTNVTTFRLKDLIDIDPNTPNVTHHAALTSTAKTRLPRIGETAEWNSRDNETVMSSILINSIPALMVENFLTGVVLRSANYDGEMITQVLKYESFVNGDISRNISKFVDAVNRQVINDITYGNQIAYTLEMSVDLLDSTTIKLSQNGEPEVIYTVPSFCDSLLAPIITSNQDTYYNLTNDIEHLLGTIEESDFGKQTMTNSIKSIDYNDSLI